MNETQTIETLLAELAKVAPSVKPYKYGGWLVRDAFFNSPDDAMAMAIVRELEKREPRSWNIDNFSNGDYEFCYGPYDAMSKSLIEAVVRVAIEVFGEDQ